MPFVKLLIFVNGLMDKSFEIEDREQRLQVQSPDFTLTNELYFESKIASSSRYVSSNCLCSYSLYRTFLAFFAALRSLSANSIVFSQPDANTIVKK